MAGASGSTPCPTIGDRKRLSYDVFRLCPLLGVLVTLSLGGKKRRPAPAGVNPKPAADMPSRALLGVPCLLLGRLADHPTTAATAVAAAPELLALLIEARRGDSFTKLSQDALRALEEKE